MFAAQTLGKVRLTPSPRITAIELPAAVTIWLAKIPMVLWLRCMISCRAQKPS